MAMRFIMWWDSFCILHQWCKWKVYEEEGVLYPGVLGRGIPESGVPYCETRQRRICLRCGKTQDELVRGVR